jgi:ABC-type transporter Mla MlaB component
MGASFQDNPDNILGVDSANNQFSSTNVTANADGSMIERLEYLQGALAASGVSPGSFGWGEAAAATASTTEIVIAALAGYGDDFFNNRYYLQVLHNADSAGDAPEAQVRKITDYVSATGTFTTDAFSANVGQDLCLVLHESLVMLGRDDTNHVAATTNVVANADGSILERLEYLQGLVGGVDGAANVLGANDADNGFDSSTVAANADGSILERLEAIKDQVELVDNFVDTEVAAIKVETDKIAGFIAAGGIGGGIARKTVTFANSGADVPLFTVTGDVITRLVAVCGTSLASAGGCNIAVVANAIPMIANTDCTLIIAGEIWQDATPDAEVELLSTMKEYIIADGNDISIDVENAKQVDSGVLNFYCIWTALSSDGAVVAA